MQLFLNLFLRLVVIVALFWIMPVTAATVSTVSTTPPPAPATPDDINTAFQKEIPGPGAAVPPPTFNNLHDGFYMGLAGGYDSYKMRHNVDIDNGVFQQNVELNAVGFSYALIGGFGLYFDPPLYWGAEFFYNYSVANASQIVDIYNTEDIYYVKSVILGTYGLSFMPGIKLSDSTLFYLKGGYTRLDVKTYETAQVFGINNAQSNGVNGFHFGLGLEANIYKHWSMRGEYTHLSCQSFRTHVNTQVTPSNNQFMVGLIFHFM